MGSKLGISIIGCGWLGLPLGENLKHIGYSVSGSTTSPGKIPLLLERGIDPYLVHFEPEKFTVAQELLSCDVLIITIPPGTRRPGGTESYQQMAAYFQRKIPQSRIRKIILISSTGVYGDTNREVSEADRPETDSESGRLLLSVENKFSSIPGKSLSIVRPAGLVGPERHPGRFFRNKTDIPNGLTPVNMIHREDVIGIILKLVEQEEASGIFNACSLTHPPKQEFYHCAAKSLGLNAPQFIPEKTNWKIVLSNRVLNELEYQFKYPDLMRWVGGSK